MWGCLSQTLADRSTDEQADNGAVTVLGALHEVIVYSTSCVRSSALKAALTALSIAATLSASITIV